MLFSVGWGSQGERFPVETRGILQKQAGAALAAANTDSAGSSLWKREAPGCGSVPALLGGCEPLGRAELRCECCALLLGIPTEKGELWHCLFSWFKINLTFPCSDLCKHGTSVGRELLLAREEPSLYPACHITVPSG